VIYLVQPPLVQLNAPYPALYYLKSFLEQRGFPARVGDHSIGLFGEIFCRPGLKRLFADARAAFEGRKTPGMNPQILYYTERFLSEEALWLACIDRLGEFLRGRDREWGHLLALANGTLPSGPRFDACLESFGGQPGVEAAPLLASKLLADLADFITEALDPSFALVRYAESLSAGVRDFSRLRESLGGYVLQNFYRPYLDRIWEEEAGSEESLPGVELPGKPLPGEVLPGGPLLLLLSIPFPGCLAGALACAESARERFGDRLITIAGGGYVNTELRFLEDPRIFDFFDFLSFDRGYGSLTAISPTQPRWRKRRRRRLCTRPSSAAEIGAGSSGDGTWKARSAGRPPKRCGPSKMRR
jgi:hypothetical protein